MKHYNRYNLDMQYNFSKVLHNMMFCFETYPEAQHWQFLDIYFATVTCLLEIWPQLNLRFKMDMDKNLKMLSPITFFINFLIFNSLNLYHLKFTWWLQFEIRTPNLWKIIKRLRAYLVHLHIDPVHIKLLGSMVAWKSWSFNMHLRLWIMQQ